MKKLKKLTLTKREEDALSFITSFLKRKNISPTWNEIAVNLKVSRQRIGILVNQLVDKGKILNKGGYRGIKLK